jgi:hypothetical protein
MTLCLLSRLFHLLLYLCSSSSFLSLSSFRADDASSVITSVLSVAQSMQFLAVFFSLNISLYYSVCQLQSLSVLLLPVLFIFCRAAFTNLSFLYFISPKGGPTFYVRNVYTTEASNSSQHRRFLSKN